MLTQNSMPIKHFEIEIEIERAREIRERERKRERLKITYQKVLKEFLSGSTEEGFSCWLEKKAQQRQLFLCLLSSQMGAAKKSSLEKFITFSKDIILCRSPKLLKPFILFPAGLNRMSRTRKKKKLIPCDFSGSISSCNVHWTCDCSLVIFTPLLRLWASVCVCKLLENNWVWREKRENISGLTLTGEC